MIPCFLRHHMIKRAQSPSAMLAPTAGMPNANGVLWGIGSDATNAAGMEAQGSQGLKEPGSREGRRGPRQHSETSSGVPTVPSPRAWVAFQSRLEPRRGTKKSRQTVRVPPPNQRPQIGQLEIPAQGFAPSPLGGGWWAVAGPTGRAAGTPGTREEPPLQRIAEVHFPTFHASFSPFASQLLGLRVCTGLPSPPATPENPSSAQESKHPSSKHPTRTQGVSVCLQCSAVGSGRGNTLPSLFSSRPISIFIVRLHRVVLLSACHDLSFLVDPQARSLLHNVSRQRRDGTFSTSNAVHCPLPAPDHQDLPRSNLDAP